MVVDANDYISLEGSQKYLLAALLVMTSDDKLYKVFPVSENDIQMHLHENIINFQILF